MRRASPFLAALATGAALLAGCLGAAAAADEVVLVPNRIIYPGETVTVSALREAVLGEGKHIPDAVAYRIEDLEGKVAKRTLLPSRYIPVTSLRDAFMVEQGAPVQVTYEAGSLTINITAICLQSGSAGDIVKVRNVDSGKVFTGVVTGAGAVRVGTS